MTQQPSGWYDDPQDATKLRYWDGVIWTDHVVPKVSPTVAQSHIGAAYDVSRAADRRHGNSNDPVPPTAPTAPTAPTSPTAPGAPGATTTPGVPGAPGTPGATTPPGGPGAPGTPGASSPWGQQSASFPAYQPAPQWQATQLGRPMATTPDGAVLAGWWKRLLARILDWAFAAVLALPLTGYFIYRYTQASLRWVDEMEASARAGGQTTSFVLPTEIYQWFIPAAVLGLLVSTAYEVFFLRRSGATPGKSIVGISVRLRDQPGAPPMPAIWRRVGVINGLTLLSGVPILGNLAGIVWLLDYLWPLWDPKKQALHDKAAATNVVLGPQPRRD